MAPRPLHSSAAAPSATSGIAYLRTAPPWMLQDRGHLERVHDLVGRCHFVSM